MEKELGTAVAGKASASASLFAGMIIFQDPAYIIISCIGAIGAMSSAYYDYHKLSCETSLALEMVKSCVIGFTISLLSITLLVSNGEVIIRHVLGDDVIVKALPSIWMIVTILIGIQATKVFDFFSKKVFGGGRDV